MSMRQVRVDTTQRAYDVLVDRGLLNELGAALRERCPAGVALVCSDQNVAPLYGPAVTASLAAAGFEVGDVVLPAGEEHKTLASVERLYATFHERRLRRSDVVVALGGGVIGDMAGFAAATYLRGVRLVQAPTTVLAQVDAAIGGKVAVDYRDGKNHVGTFYQPLLVVADPDAHRTLPERELRNGMAEVIKYAFLLGGDLIGRVSAAATTRRLDADLIAECVAIKAAVVAKDEREEDGERQLLNLGHTVGHAIEAAGGFGHRSHGEAVALGLRAALALSERLTGLSAAEAEHGNRLLSSAGLPERLAAADPAEVCGLVARDKKAGPAGVEYVLLEALGKPVRGVHVPPPLLEEVVSWLTKR